MSVHKYSNNFSSPCFSLPSKLFRTNSSFLLSPDFLDHAVARKGLILGNTGCLLLFRQTINICQEALLIGYQGHKTRLHCSFPKPFPWSSTTRPKFLKSNLVFDLFHGYKDLARQSSWWSILFCVYVYIHWSKAVALFAQFLSSLPERNSTNERRPWQNYMPRVQETVSDFWKWKSQRTSHQFSYQ